MTLDADVRWAPESDIDSTPTLADLVAQARQAQGLDWTGAASVAQTLRRRYPDHPAGYQVGAAAARTLLRFDEAAELVAAAATRFPTETWPLIERTLLAAGRGDNVAALEAAAALRTRYPDVPTGYLVGSASARALRRFDEATIIAADALLRFPDDDWPMMELARTTQACGRHEEAIGLAEDLRRRSPGNPVGYQMGAAFLSGCDRLRDAAALYHEAVRVFPTAAWPAQGAAAAERSFRNRERAVDLLRTLDQELALPAQPAGKVIVVLGMHRSGTSLCTRIVQGLGVDLGGPLLTPSFDNPEGFQEHRGIVNAHVALLEMLSANWDTLRLVQSPPEAFWQSPEVALVRGRLKRLVSAQLEAAGGVWAFKDPRTLRFLPLWQNILSELGVQPVWLLAVRDPHAVASSLYARNGIPHQIGELLWVEHYLDALRHLGPHIAGIIHYERWFTSASEQLRTLRDVVGDVPEAAAEAVGQTIRAELRHNRSDPDAAMLGLARQVHGWLLQDSPDLRHLQHAAETLWRRMEGIANRSA